MDLTLSELQNVFEIVFDDAGTVTESTTAADIDGWDSMGHIRLILTIEKHFGIRFNTVELGGLGGGDQNVGSLIRLIESKRGTKSRPFMVADRLIHDQVSCRGADHLAMS